MCPFFWPDQIELTILGLFYCFSGSLQCCLFTYTVFHSRLVLLPCSTFLEPSGWWWRAASWRSWPAGSVARWWRTPPENERRSLRHSKESENRDKFWTVEKIFPYTTMSPLYHLCHYHDYAVGCETMPFLFHWSHHYSFNVVGRETPCLRSTAKTC